LYEAAYGSAPPRIERHSDKVKAQVALEERERLSGAATQDKRAKLYFIGGLARRVLAVLPRRQAHTCGRLCWTTGNVLCVYGY